MTQRASSLETNMSPISTTCDRVHGSSDRVLQSTAIADPDTPIPLLRPLFETLQDEEYVPAMPPHTARHVYFVNRGLSAPGTGTGRIDDRTASVDRHISHPTVTLERDIQDVEVVTADDSEEVRPVRTERVSSERRLPSVSRVVEQPDVGRDPSSFVPSSWEHERDESSGVSPEVRLSPIQGSLNGCESGDDSSYDLPDLEVQVFQFFNEVKYDDLKLVAKDWGFRVGIKCRMVARCMIHYRLESEGGKTHEEIIRSNPSLPDFVTWLQSKPRPPSSWISVPSESELLSQMEEPQMRKWKAKIAQARRGTPRNDSAATLGRRVGPPEFCLNEFARLMVLLRDDEHAKHAVHRATGGQLGRLALEYGANRDNYWDVVASRFNDHAVDSRQSFSGRLDDVDSNSRPLCQREASSLKAQYTTAKTSWLLPLRRWESSGNNNPQSFVGKLIRVQSGDLTRESKRAFIVFCVAGMGDKDGMDQDFVTLMRKDFSKGYEEGMPVIGGPCVAVDRMSVPGLSTPVGRKRNRLDFQGQLQANCSKMGDALVEQTKISHRRLDVMEKQQTLRQTSYDDMMAMKRESHIEAQKLFKLKAEAAAAEIERSRAVSARSTREYNMSRIEELSKAEALEMSHLDAAAERLNKCNQRNNPVYYDMCSENFYRVKARIDDIVKAREEILRSIRRG